MTMTDVSPIVTGLTGASQLASAGSSMTVRAMRQECIINGRFPLSQWWNSASQRRR